MDPVPAKTPFTDTRWAFEMLPGGYRMLAEVGQGSAALRSRTGADTTERFSEVAGSLANLPVSTTVLDGEICAFDRAGRNDRDRLKRRGAQLAPDLVDAVTYCIYDVLVCDGTDVRREPWWKRRQLLESLPLGALPHLSRQRALRTHGEWLYRQAEALGRAGLSARRRDGAYSGGASVDWRWIPVAPGKPAVVAARWS